MRRTRNELSGKVAAVTGAASGIGRALAVELCALGASVALSDVDEIGLAETATQCASFDTSVMNERVDVSNRSEVFDWAQHVVDSHGRVNLIFNNAGVGLSGTAEHQSIDDFGWLMDINFWGVVHGTQAFLPYLRESGSTVRLQRGEVRRTRLLRRVASRTRDGRGASLGDNRSPRRSQNRDRP
jgi:NADP-dependent 3-hydroxy acid dehydrogenase YdfG